MGIEGAIGPEGGRVTLIEAQKRRPARMNVHLDGVFAFSAEASVVQATHVCVGDLLDTEAVGRLLAADERESAHSRALKFLELRERSRQEVRRRLEKYGYEGGVVERTLDWLSGLGYLDDARYAKAYILEKIKAGWGSARIAGELGRRGVAPVIVASVVEEVEDAAKAESGQDRLDEDLAALVRKRFRRESERDSVGARRRAYAFLARRGHDPERISRVLRLSVATEDDREDAPA